MALSVSELAASEGLVMMGPVPWNTRLDDRAPGVYVISLNGPETEAIRALPEDKQPRWIAGQEIVYIGRSVNLSRRLGEFYRHVWGAARPHRGGQDIKLLNGNLNVYWALAEDCALAEKRLLDFFVGQVGAFPFANRVRATQKRQSTKAATGISDRGLCRWLGGDRPRRL